MFERMTTATLVSEKKLLLVVKQQNVLAFKK